MNLTDSGAVHFLCTSSLFFIDLVERFWVYLNSFLVIFKTLLCPAAIGRDLRTFAINLWTL